METAPTLLGIPVERDRGRATIYDTLTAETSEVLVTMLPQLLRKRRTDRSKVFTEHKPDFAPVRGSLKCNLHPDDPNREHYSSLGLPTCPKSNLTSIFHVRRHMKARHNMEWGIIEQDRKDAEELRKVAERKEDREFQQKLMSKAVEAPLYVSGKDRKLAK